MLKLFEERQMALVAAVTAAACGCSTALAAPARQSVESVQPLLLTAVKQGQAYGVLIGPAADAIANQFVSRAPINIDVTAVGDLPTPGCKRLLVDTHQDQVVDRDRSTQPGVPGQPQKAKPMGLKYQISYCANGTFPPSARRAAPTVSSEEKGGGVR
jgi:hypothetical protein